VVVLLIAANVAVYVYQALLPLPTGMAFVYTYAAIPAVLVGHATFAQVLPRGLEAAAHSSHLTVAPLQPVWLSVFTSMFLHGGLLHIGSNMLYLWIFGNNVEDTLGHFRFLVFYVTCGLVAAIAQILMSAHSALPMLGASGAIACLGLTT
jgi:membrane associated rhomboid family serine protease